MPQDSFRSVVYRSFVTCDDPKGVAEGATVRKSKNNSQKLEGRIQTESQRRSKTLIRYSSYKKGEKEELEENLSSFQLMEVKKGAQKLNKVIDSWSKGVHFEGQSKDIAKDLLRGALDLQESLAMLGKLQEASHYMARFKKKQKEKVYEAGLERTGSECLENRNYEMGGVQTPKISVDGSSQDCYEELRDVIRDSLGRQNLLPIGSYEQRAYLDRRKVEQSSDMPSTSSSRSSVSYSYEFASSDSLSTKMTEGKSKGSNLIAKLMGLEDISSKSLKSTPQKHLERDRAFSLRRPVFDIDLPMTRKSQFVVQKVDREPMTLDKIIEAMHSKGLLRSNNHQSDHSNSSYLEKRFSDDSPPIVLMKPHRTEVFENDMAQNWKTREDFPPKIKKVNSGVMHEQETFTKKHRKENGGRDFEERFIKAEDEKVEVIGKSYSTIVKVSATASPKPQKKETIEKKVDKIQKLAPNRKKPLEMDNVKPSSIHKTRAQEKVTLSKGTKPEARSNSVKSRQISPQKARNTSPIQKSISPCKSSDGKKNGKIENPVRKCLATNAEKNRSETDDKQTDNSCEYESNLSVTNAAPVVQILNKEKTEASPEVRSEELCDDNQHSPSEATRFSTKHDREFEAPEEVNCCISPEITKSNYLNRNHDSDEFFDIDAYRATVLQKINFHDSETPHSKLLLDCANELLKHKNLRQIPAIHPLQQNQTIKSRFCISVDQLTRDVSDGLENLSGYCKCTKESPRADTIHGMLERDLWWKGDVGGSWDMCWRDGFSLEEVEEIVGDLEMFVLSELIQNVLADFLC